MKTLQERFEASYIPEPNSGCWLWSRACFHDGYGLIKDRPPSRRDLRAHRVSWQLHNGKIPAGLCVLHRCDVRCCVNPDHLFLGTTQDNTADCKSKGRFCEGERQWMAKLTIEDILKIRDDPRPLKEIAGDFNLSIAYVGKIKHRQKWKHL